MKHFIDIDSKRVLKCQKNGLEVATRTHLVANTVGIFARYFWFLFIHTHYYKNIKYQMYKNSIFIDFTAWGIISKISNKAKTTYWSKPQSIVNHL